MSAHVWETRDRIAGWDIPDRVRSLVTRELLYLTQDIEDLTNKDWLKVALACNLEYCMRLKQIVLSREQSMILIEDFFNSKLGY